MDKRNKHWRREKMSCLFKSRMLRFAEYGTCIISQDGTINQHPHWFELAKEKWTQAYKSTGTPCSCWICRGEKYNRNDFKRESLRIIRESLG